MEGSFITWSVEPMIFPSLGFLRWYGVCWALGLLLSYQVVSTIFKQEGVSLKELDQLVLYLLVGVLVGARLGHILFYDPLYYYQHPGEILPFRIQPTFQFTGLAGLASHGGTLGVILALFLYCRKYKKRFLWIADRVAIAGCLLGSFIRVGNLLNSEILGKETTMGWAFVFTRVDNIPRHPTQLYEAFGYLFIFVLLLFLWKKRTVTMNGSLFGLSLMWVFGLRFIVEFFKMDQVPFEASLPLNMGQVLSIPLVLTGLIMWASRLSKPKASLPSP